MIWTGELRCDVILEACGRLGVCFGCGERRCRCRFLMWKVVSK